MGNLLEGSGFHTRRTYQEGLGQLDDREVAAYAAAESLIVVTHDGAFYKGCSFPLNRRCCFALRSRTLVAA